MSHLFSRSAASRRRWRRATVIGAVFGLALLLLNGRQLAALLPGFSAWVDGLGGWGPAAFVVGYVLATVALVPGVILTMAAGVLFGLLEGTLLVFLAATLGATAAFLVARHGGRRFAARAIADRPTFTRIDHAVGRQGLKIAFLLRLSPLFPFSLLNYALGLTSIHLRDYVVACLGMLPATFLYVYYGKALGSLAAIVAGQQERRLGDWVLLAAGLVLTAVVTAAVTRIARRELEREVGNG